MFKYIENINTNWRNEGIKDYELRYFDDFGEKESDRKEVQELILNAILNISLCLLKREKWGELKVCCDDIISKDQNNLKG